MIFPLASPAIFAKLTALSWISAVSTVLLGKTGTAVNVWTPVVVAVPDISTLALISASVAFSSISECSSAYRSKILSEFLPRSKTVIIGETAPQISLWVKDYITTHFKFIHVVHSTRLQDGHSLIFASNDDTLKVEL